MVLEHPIHHVLEQEGYFRGEDQESSAHYLLSGIPWYGPPLLSPTIPHTLRTFSPSPLTHSTGEQSFQAASSYVRDKFLELNENKEKAIYAHMTCATDTTNIIIVFNAVRDILLNVTLQSF
jgi:hypothetical protein